MSNRHMQKIQVMLQMALALSSLGTCARRRVGCILTDASFRIVGSGYNGVVSNQEHCTDKPCLGASHSSGSNTSLYLCEAVHAEQNALLQCKDVYRIFHCFVTCSPCIQCTKLLLNTGCHHVHFLGEHSHDDKSRSLWLDATFHRKGVHSWEHVGQLV